MGKIKAVFMALLAGLVLWAKGLCNETQTACVHVYMRGVEVMQGLFVACTSLVLIPVHAVGWVWGCLKQTVKALASILEVGHH